jgi:plastocyanin
LALLVAGGFSPAAFTSFGPFLIPALVFIALLTWRPNPWFYLATGIAVSYLFIVFLPFIIGGLTNPASPYEFSGDVLGLVAVFWALPAGVLGFWVGRKGTPQVDARSGWRTRQGLYALGVAFVAIGAIMASAIAYSHAVGTQAGSGFDFQVSATVNLTTQNFLFDPSTFTVSAHTITAIVVTNGDAVLHTFTYEFQGQTYTHDLLPGTTTKFLVFFAVSGSIPFWCIPHRSMGMTGLMTVS